MYKNFNNIYNNKRVLITGNTGFKGSWLSIWLNLLGAEVSGISIDIPTQPSNYEISKLNTIINHHFCDIRDYEKTYKIIEKIKPEFIFHLAAQPLVRESFLNPKKTIETNVLGTTNILEIIRNLDINCRAVIITSDKCYNNVEWTWGYREIDELGGEDPYSASKGASELIIKTYAKSFFNKVSSNVKIVSARAGNVIGGGDWANYRIVPDAVKAWTKSKTLLIRYPKATRPWQHVLEPLSGYLLLGQKLSENPNLNGEAFNFGPNSNQSYTVEHLLNEMADYWPGANWDIEGTEDQLKEAWLLKLNCDKALHYLGWQPTIDFKQTVRFVADWYQNYFFNEKSNMFEFSVKQIKEFSRIRL